jgi:hypothetical protein
MTLLLLSLACSDKEPIDSGEDTGVEADADTDADSDTDTDADTDVEPQGFAVEGATLDLATQTGGAEGLCLDIVDPSAAFTGGDLEMLGGTTLGADGTWRVEEIETDSVLGLFMLVTDCDGVAPVMPTASGVPFADYDGLGTGDTVENRRAIVVSEAMAAGVAQSLTAAGYQGDIATDGFVLGFVRDTAGTPVEGATVSCGDGCTVYYADTENADGMFTSAQTGLNTSTAAQTGGMFVVPGGPLTSYSASHDSLSFPAVTFGGMPGLVTVMAFAGE